MSSVISVIPIYKDHLSEAELLSLRHFKTYLANYPSIIVVPEKLIIPKELTGFNYIRLAPAHFRSVETYSRLLLARSFYSLFSDYTYILLYQLDALVFSSDLDVWVNKDYDYVGAPLFNSVVGFLSDPKYERISVGNGGLSLRKISSFLRVLDSEESTTGHAITMYQSLRRYAHLRRNIWLDHPTAYPFNEDGFWSFEAHKYLPEFSKPDWREAAQFSIEKNPRKMFSEIGEQLPFGCHAWEKYDKEFWSNFLLQ